MLCLNNTSEGPSEWNESNLQQKMMDNQNFKGSFKKIA